MPYSKTYACEEIGGYGTADCPPPTESINDKLTETMAALKELLMAMDDTSMVIFGMPCPQPGDKPPEPNCLNGMVDTIRAQAKLALGAFMEMRKKLV